MSLILLGILNSQAAAAGGAGAYDLLETQTLTGSAASVTFTGLDSYSDYKHLQIRMVGRSQDTGTLVKVLANADTTNYAAHYLRGLGTSVSSGFYGSGVGNNYIADITQSGWGANEFGAAVIDILDFSSTAKNKTFRAISGYASNSNLIRLSSGLWYGTPAAITSLTLSTNSGGFVANSRFSIYGVR